MSQRQLVDTVVYQRNRRAFPPEQLAPYQGKCVTWNAEGTTILAAGDSWAELYERMKELGIDPCETVDEYIPDPEQRTSNPHTEYVDTVRFDRNRMEFPDDQLEPYWGMFVAWNAEGTAIVAAGKTREEVFQQLRELGIPPGATVGDFIPDPNLLYLPEHLNE
jgi:hypothetical protein